MSTELKLFENLEVRFFPTEDGSFEVVAKDVLKALEYSDESFESVNKIFASVPVEWADRKPIPVRSSNGVEQKREMFLLKEQGLYFFLARSDKPKALPFQKWLAGEVVPSIRKTGEYVVKQPENIHSNLAERLPLILAIYQAAKLEGNQLALALDKVHVLEGGYSALRAGEVQLIAPQQQQLYTPSELGRQLEPPLSPIKVNKLLEQMGWQVKVEKKWEAIGEGEKFGVYLDTGKQHSNGTPVRQLKWAADVIFALQGQLNSDE